MRASIKPLVIAALLLLVSSVSAFAETLMMPKRDAKKNLAVVVWGVSTLPNGTAYTLDYGDGTSVSGTVSDRSYIAFPHTYATAGIFTATLTVGAESSSTQIQVFDPATMTATNLRNLGINMAIEDGLRYLWTSQINRTTNFPAGTQTYWNTSWNSSVASMVVLAFQNHGYKLNNDGSAPTGIYQKYIVRRGLNFVFSSLTPITLNNQTAGNPCVGVQPAAEYAGAVSGVAAGTCIGLADRRNDTFHEAYTTSVAMLAIAGSGALSRVNTEVSGYTGGKTFGEILQRMSNAMVWGQIDGGTGRGGWYYNFNGSSFDGSTVGWGILSLLDADAAGVVVPAFARTEFAFGLNNAHNTNGSLDYQGDGNAASLNNVGMEKGGIPLQGMFFTGQSITPGSKFEATVKYISDRWTSSRIGGDTNWGCQVNLPSGAQFNFGCAYSMFNVFKGLKLAGVTTLPGVTRAAGPGAIPAGDWYADYQDWLVGNQTTPTSTTGGYWGTMQFSCCQNDSIITAAVAELILSPVALVLPDEAKFSTVGLSPATNSALELTTHTVTAHAESTGGAAVPGATVNFTILTGPNAGLTGSGVTDSNGNATFTYTDQGPLGTTGVDTIQATIGSLTSNTVEMTWLPLNAAPVAVDDAASTFSGTPVTVAVLGNDTDADGDTLTVTGTSGGPANGSVSVNGDGTITYTPNLGFAGTDTFSYAIADGKGGTASATVTITVSKRAASVTAGSGSKVYGDADPALTPTATGFLAGDGIVVTQTARDGGENVGTYATHAEASGATLANYDVTYTDGTLTITPAPTTTVVTCPASVVYTSTAQTVCTATVTGAGGLNEAVTPVTYTNNVNVGTAGASATYEGSDNHSGSTGSATFAITPAPLTVTANSYTRSYLAADPVLSGTLTGVLGADGITATYSSTGTGSQVPGVYPTVPTLVDPNGKLGNYAVSATNGTLTITNTVPVCTIAPSISSIWPPNHKMVSITASGATDVDGGPLTYKVVSIFQDEPTNTTGDGNTAIDGAGIGTSTAQVRAERTGDPKNPGDGRVYHITFSVTDSLGLSCQATVKVGVPHDQSGKVQPIDGGPIFDSTVAGPPPAATAKGKGK